jgi:predicted nucleic acid-binding protein
VRVVDASVWVSRLVPQDFHHQDSKYWFEGQATEGGMLVSPVLLLAEVAGAIARRSGQGKLAEDAIQGMLRLSGLRLVAIDSRLGRAASRLAARLGLRGADAIYVAVAHQLHIPLITWDLEQQEKARGLIEVRTPDVDAVHTP